jgi:hypothetical protein
VKVLRGHIQMSFIVFMLEVYTDTYVDVSYIDRCVRMGANMHF